MQELTEEGERRRREVRKLLAEGLRKSIKAVVSRDYEAVNEAFRRLDANSLAVFRRFGASDEFPAPDTRRFSVGSSTGVDSVVLNAAIPRLLDLGLVECGIHGDKYVYFWTYLGNRLLVKQGWRQEN